MATSFTNESIEREREGEGQRERGRESERAERATERETERCVQANGEAITKSERTDATTQGWKRDTKHGNILEKLGRKVQP